MTKLFAGLEFVLLYIGNVLVVTKGGFKDRLKKLDVVLTEMKNIGMQLEPKKVIFGSNFGRIFRVLYPEKDYSHNLRK